MLLAAACVAYEPDHIDASIAAREVEVRVGGSFDVERALRYALVQNPDLRVLEAEVRAAHAETVVPLSVLGEFRGRNQAVGAVVDPVELLGLGPRGGAIDEAEARAVAAVAALANERWQILAGVVECFLVDAALAELEVIQPRVDPRAFEQAGLAAVSDAANLRAAEARARAEVAALERDRVVNRERLRQLLGLPASASLEMFPIDSGWLQQPPSHAGVLLGRPDLRLATERFRAADAAFRKAVADQYPSLQLGPNVSLLGDPLRAMATLRVPIGMHGAAEAARARRDAAREKVLDEFLHAQEEAATSEVNLSAATDFEVAAVASFRASRTAFEAARVAVEVDPDAFAAYARAAAALQGRTATRRTAAVQLARAKIARARAFGWPREGGS